MNSLGRRRSLSVRTLTGSWGRGLDGHGGSRSEAIRVPAALEKVHSDQLSDGTPAYDYSGLLEELATVTRQEIRLSGSDTTFPKLTTPTPLQQRAFSLLGLPIAL